MTESRPAAEGEGMYDKYMLHHPSDIRGCLRQLVDRHSIVLVHAAGTDNAVSVALGVDASSLWVDVPRDPELTARLLAADRLRFESSIERITVRFATGAAREVLHEGLPALQIPLPVKVMHLQRREYVRREPLGTISCLLPAHGGQGAPRSVRATIADIGGGGLAVLTSDDATLEMKTGDLFPGVLLELPEQEPMSVVLRVQHAQRVELNGRRVWRAGCSFVDLTVGDQARLLRYVMQLDRLHMARLRDDV
ncbi:flagellar brake protein [Cognatilysobacter lacus]|uniref:Flagellar brake protein n=1 Tax=Cognatilysobacter lacus TaxID=1643323 RepID=A0A5D8YX40_9GAMM|nr:flagellar brake protein [Lysobacter lacus]TZF87305.1 flagellar brake protein [Lysobacter lacus]